MNYRNSQLVSFSDGFGFAVRLFRAGETWELISHHPNYDHTPAGRGMFAAVEAMSGWLDVARRVAKAHGEAEASIERLIELARTA
jgi:hypothetical protein